MMRGKTTRIFLSCFLLLMAMWIAVPKVYIHALTGHEHESGQLVKDSETKVDAPSSEDCDFEKYNKPAYFNLFKFICSFIPSKGKAPGKIAEKAIRVSASFFANALLRAPPAH